MATIVRPKDEKPVRRKKVPDSRRQESGSGNQDPGDSVILGPCSGSRADPNGGVKMRDFWQLRQEISNALNRIDELEAQVLILARGGKEKEFYSVEEAAQIWGVSKSNLYLMIRQGRIPAIKIGEVVRIARGTLVTGPTN